MMRRHLMYSFLPMICFAAEGSAAPAAAAKDEAESSFDANAVSMMDLIGVDMTDVKEVRATVWPKCTADWEILSMENEKTKGKDDNGNEVPKFVSKVKVKCLQINTVSGLAQDLDKNEYVGKEMFINLSKNILKSGKEGEAEAFKWMGMVKSFCVDVGVAGNLAFGELCSSTKGRRFTAAIKHRANPEDTDRPFTFIDTQKIKPLTA